VPNIAPAVVLLGTLRFAQPTNDGMAMHRPATQNKKGRVFGPAFLRLS
jgi:hypothetical protein